jgi:hypothetical protein
MRAFRNPTRWTRRLPIAGKRYPWPRLGLPVRPEVASARRKSMTYMVYHILRWLPRPVLLGLLVVLLTTLARA